MTTLVQTNNNSKPLERMKTPALIQDNPENIEGKDIAGFFDETSGGEPFNANGGGQILFNLPELDASTIAINPDRALPNTPQSNIFKDGAIVTFGAVQKGADIVGKTFGDTTDALSDLFQTATGKTEVSQAFQKAFEGKDPSKLDPDVAAEQQEKAEEYSATKQREESVAAELARINRDLENQDRLTPLRQNISSLTGLPEWLSDIVSEGGEVRTDLVAPAEARKKVLETQQTADKGPITSASKKGGQGQVLDKDDNKSGERQGSTAQTATG